LSFRLVSESLKQIRFGSSSLAFGYLAFWQVMFWFLPKVKLCAKICHVGGGLFFSQRSCVHRAAEQSVHLTLGILRVFQAFSCA